MEQKPTRGVGTGVMAAAAAYQFIRSGETTPKGAVLVWAKTVGFVFAFAIAIFAGLPLEALFAQ